MEDSPILFVKAGCPWCEDALAHFARKGFQPQIVDVRADPSRMQELIDASGQSLTPTLKFGDFVVADFSVDEFEAALTPEVRAALGL